MSFICMYIYIFVLLHDKIKRINRIFIIINRRDGINLLPMLFHTIFFVNFRKDQCYVFVKKLVSK